VRHLEIIAMNICTSRLTTQLQHTTAERESLCQELIYLVALQQTLAGEREKVRNTVSALALDNQRLTYALETKSSHKDSGSAAEWEKTKREKELFLEWIEDEIREGNAVLTALLALRGTEEASLITRELKRQTESLEEGEPVAETLKEFSVWKYANAVESIKGIGEEREALGDFVRREEEWMQQWKEGGRLKLEQVRAEMGTLASNRDLLTRFKALKEIERRSLTLLTPETSNSDEEAKLILSQQAEELQALHQQLTAQRIQEEMSASAAEKELRLKDVYIQHLESKVKHLSRRSQLPQGVRDQEIQQLRREVAGARAEQVAVEAELEAANARTAELQERSSLNSL